MTKAREFKFTPKDFKELKALTKSHTGIELNDSKQDMVYGRLTRRMRELKLSSFREYVNLLKNDPADEELLKFANAMTTNLTAFFRESHHFDYMKQVLIPKLLKSNSDSRKIRIWSAGCSTGEEPYSIAMIIAETVPADWDVKILATDLDTNVLVRGSSGIYPESATASIGKARLRKWFLKGAGSNTGLIRVKPVLRNMITFKRLNLMHQWPMKHGFDIIFCRNVIIYFDAETKTSLVDRYFDLLTGQGTIFVGHSETLFGVTQRANLVGKTIYEKK